MMTGIFFSRFLNFLLVDSTYYIISSCAICVRRIFLYDLYIKVIFLMKDHFNKITFINDKNK
jgi:hypothetical protein